MMRLPDVASCPSLVFAAVVAASLVITAPAGAQISAVVTDSGQISLSLDASGSNAASHAIGFEKPAGATVRSVYIAAATYSGATLPDGQITIDGVPVFWDMKFFNDATYDNGWADITGTSVTTTLNAAPAGPGTLTITEGASNTSIDGEILAIIWDDPNVPPSDTQGIILLFGGQAQAGDTFNVNLSEPLDLSSGDVKADLALGISFGFQPNTPQISEIDVNGSRMTSSAGGQDDGAGENGALITVGGVGDTNGNPPPFAVPVTESDPDDELYDLLPFYVPSSTLIVIDTFNPSNDDNIFFGAICTSVAAITQGILLSPAQGTCVLGADNTVTALVLDSLGAPVTGTTVNFLVVSGPNAGDAGSDVTDANGEATFTYTGDGGIGVDCVVASFVDSQGVTQTSNQAKKTWQEQCMLVMGDGDGFVSYTPADHTFITQVGQVQSMEPVLLDDLATVRVPVKAMPSVRQSGFGATALPLQDDVIEQFTAQVLMWNPLDFPTAPEKYTQGVLVTVTKYGSVSVVPYGQNVGMDLWVETVHVAHPAPGTSATPYVDITFPFSIEF